MVGSPLPQCPSGTPEPSKTGEALAVGPSDVGVDCFCGQRSTLHLRARIGVGVPDATDLVDDLLRGSNESRPCFVFRRSQGVMQTLTLGVIQPVPVCGQELHDRAVR